MGNREYNYEATGRLDQDNKATEEEEVFEKLNVKMYYKKLQHQICRGKTRKLYFPYVHVNELIVL